LLESSEVPKFTPSSPAFSFFFLFHKASLLTFFQCSTGFGVPYAKRLEFFEALYSPLPSFPFLLMPTPFHLEPSLFPPSLNRLDFLGTRQVSQITVFHSSSRSPLSYVPPLSLLPPLPMFWELVDTTDLYEKTSDGRIQPPPFPSCSLFFDVFSTFPSCFQMSRSLLEL